MASSGNGFNANANASLSYEEYLNDCNYNGHYQQQILQYIEQQHACYDKLMEERRLLSFLEVDNSFLTPWSWKPNEDDDVSCNVAGSNLYKSQQYMSLSTVAGSDLHQPKQYMSFTPGSFFSYDVHDTIKKIKRGYAAEVKVREEAKESKLEED